MNESIGVILIIFISSITLSSLLATLIYLIPARVKRTRHTIEQAPGRAFLIGLVNMLFFGVLAAIFANGGDVGGLIGVIILLVLGGFAAIGLSSIVSTLRDRLYPDLQGSGMKAAVKTAVLLILATLTPFIGWFVLAPILLLIGLGGAITTFVRHRKTSEQSKVVN